MKIEERRGLILGLREDVFNLQREFSGKMNTKIKNDNPRDVVTDADKEIEEFLTRKIKKLFIEDKVIGEELGISDGGSGFEWYLDPIDGTAYFARGEKEYGTSVGLVLNGKIVFGAIFYAEDQKVYWAEEGKGAFCEDERIQCSSKKEKLSESILSAEVHFDSKQAEKVFEALKNIYPHFNSLRMGGSCITNLIRVAIGKIDACWLPEYISPYDFCAGALIVKEAGGFVSHEDPEKFITPEQGQLFASNGIIHRKFVELVNRNYAP